MARAHGVQTQMALAFDTGYRTPKTLQMVLSAL
jgi:hypothetical protein